MRFQDGDVVKIAKSSKYYGRGRHNPKDTEGKLWVGVGETGGGFDYKVTWGEGRKAWYNDNDLRLVRRQQ